MEGISQDLIQKAREGDQRALQDLFCLALPWIRAELCRHEAPYDALDDLTQECAIRLLRALTKGSPRGRCLRGLVRAIVRCANTDSYRRKGAKKDIQPVSLEENPEPSREDRDELELEEARRGFRREWQRMSEELRQVYLLLNVHGLKSREIAEYLEISPTTVKRLRREIAERLGRALGWGEDMKK